MISITEFNEYNYLIFMLVLVPIVYKVCNLVALLQPHSRQHTATVLSIMEITALLEWMDYDILHF